MNQQDQIIDTMAIHKIVGKFSNAAGHPAEQKKFLAPDCQVGIYFGEEKILELTGQKNFENGLTKLTDKIKKIHCMNGQHTIDFITKDKATGLLFCREIQVTEEFGENIITEHCIYHEDIYERQRSGEWLIKARDTHYFISDKRVMGVLT